MTSEFDFSESSGQVEEDAKEKDVVASEAFDAFFPFACFALDRLKGIKG